MLSWSVFKKLVSMPAAASCGSGFCTTGFANDCTS